MSSLSVHSHLTSAAASSIATNNGANKLSAYVLKHIALFAGVDACVSATRVCRAWSATFADDLVWKRLSGVTKPEYAELQKNISLGRYVRREIVFDGMSSHFHSALSHPVSNCYLIPEKTPTLRRATVYEFNGVKICTIDLPDSLIYAQTELTYATQNELIVIGNGVKPICALFAKQTGALLREFTIAHGKLDRCTVVAVLENPNQILVQALGNFFHTYFVFDFEGNALFTHKLPQNSVADFSMLRRSFIYNTYDGIFEECLGQAPKRLFDSPKWTRLHNKVAAAYCLCTDGELICIASDQRELSIASYHTGKGVMVSLPLWGGNTISHLSVVNGHIFVKIRIGDNRDSYLVYDRSGNEALNCPHLDSRHYEMTLSSFQGWFLTLTHETRSGRAAGRLLKSSESSGFQLIGASIPHEPVHSWGECRTASTSLSFLCNDRILIHDYTPQAVKSAEQENARKEMESQKRPQPGTPSRCIVC